MNRDRAVETLTTRPALSKPARWVAVFCIIAFLATMWPLYLPFSRVRPLILGIPASLAYLIGLVAVSFFSLLALYSWERRRGKLD